MSGKLGQGLMSRRAGGGSRCPGDAPTLLTQVHALPEGSLSCTLTTRALSCLYLCFPETVPGDLTRAGVSATLLLHIFYVWLKFCKMSRHYLYDQERVTASPAAGRHPQPRLSPGPSCSPPISPALGTSCLCTGSLLPSPTRPAG